MPQISKRMSAGWAYSHRLRHMILIALLTAVPGGSLPAYADGFHLELAYCDVQEGPLTLTPDGGQALPDGCLGQVIEHRSDGEIPRPAADGNPGGSDRVLNGSVERRDSLIGESFRVNGAERLQTAGFFFVDPVLEGNNVPHYPLYLRIWNAETPSHATYYYETPLYTAIDGTQQMNFDRSQLVIYPASHTMAVHEGPDNSVPLEYNVLSSYPNPFNPDAVLTYALEQPAQVAVDLYDLQGRRAAKLFKGNVNAGAHSLRFNGSAYPSGTYFAILTVNGGNVSTRRMVLLK